MAQLTIYLPEKIAEATKQHAKRKKLSVSAYITDLLTREASRERWPQQLVDLLGEGEADLVEPDDPPPEDLEPLE